MAKSKIKIPAIVTRNRIINPSHASMSQVSWVQRDSMKPVPLGIIDTTVVGVKANRVTGKAQEIKETNANIKRLDMCELGPDYDTLRVDLTIKVLSGVDEFEACSDASFAKIYTGLIKDYSNKFGFGELAYRYALNIASARFLWRNRVGAENIEVRVYFGEHLMCFNSMDINIEDFSGGNDIGTHVEDLKLLANIIASALKGDVDSSLLTIVAFSQLGTGQEVYPSQEFVQNKNSAATDSKSKLLCQKDGVAGIHARKIGNALRTIDTWYDEYKETKTAIPVENYGTVVRKNKAYRSKPKDFFSLFDKFMNGEKMDENDLHYVVAIMIRGGLFGKKGG